MNDHDYSSYDEDDYDYHASQEMTREEKFWFVLVFIIFFIAMLAGAFGGMVF